MRVAWVSGVLLPAVFPLSVAVLPLLGAFPVDSYPYVGMLASLSAGIALCAIGTGMFLRKDYFLSLPVIFFVAAFSVFVCASVLASEYTGADSWWGAGFEFGTAGSFLLFAVAVFCGSLIPRSLDVWFPYGFIASACLAAAASLLVFAFGSLVERGETIAGTWQQMSFLFGAALLAALLLFDDGKVRAFASVSICFLAAGFAVFFLPTASVAFLVSAAGSAAYLYFRHRTLAVRTGIAAAAVLLLMLFGFGGAMSESSPDARPSILATSLIIAPLYQESLLHALVGSGPGTLPVVWERHRILQFNASPFWNARVDSTHSTATTVAVLLGVLGAGLALLWPVAFVFQSGEFPGAALFALGAFLFVSQFLYPTGLVALLVLGVVLGMCARGDPFKIPVLLRWALACLCVAASLMLAWISVHQMLAAHLHSKGLLMTREGDISAVSVMEKAERVWGVQQYSIDASRAYTSKAQQLLPTIREDDEVRRQIQLDLKAAASFANHAVESNPKDFSAWMYRAELYIAFIPFGFPDAESLAYESLQQAAALAPLRPDVPLLKARGALQAGRPDVARQFAEDALALKPDYEEAKRFIEKLPVSNVP